jgi:hypothetical protein
MSNPVRIPIAPANLPGIPEQYSSSYTWSSTSDDRVMTTSPDGITVKEAGTYLVNGYVKVNEKNQADTFAIGVNGRTNNTNTHNTFATDGPGYQLAEITTLLTLNPGDTVSVNLVSQGTAALKAWMSTSSGMRGGEPVPGSPSVGLSMVKIA